MKVLEKMFGNWKIKLGAEMEIQESQRELQEA